LRFLRKKRPIALPSRHSRVMSGARITLYAGGDIPLRYRTRQNQGAPPLRVKLRLANIVPNQYRQLMPMAKIVRCFDALGAEDPALPGKAMGHTMNIRIQGKI